MSFRSFLIVLGLALLGLLAAASIGFASYYVSRDSVGLPVTKLEDPQELTPVSRARVPQRTVSTRTSTEDDDKRGTTTDEDSREPDDDNSGSGSSGSGSGGSGSGSGGSGSSGRGRGGDDD